MQVYIFLITYRKNRLLNKQKLTNFKLSDGMQKSMKNNISPEMVRPIVVRSLRGSKVRKKIVDYLFDISPSGSYVSDIAYNIETSPSNVIGALRGMNLRYKHDESLIGLNIVELIKKDNNTDLKLYRLTDFGKEILESLKNSK